MTWVGLTRNEYNILVGKSQNKMENIEFVTLPQVDLNTIIKIPDNSQNLDSPFSIPNN
jgi:hypothetical protein